jgi:phosphate transport system substrate-binding protein
LKERKTIIIGLFVLMVVLAGAQIIGAYSKQGQPARESSLQRVARLMEWHHGNIKEDSSAGPTAEDSNKRAIRALIDRECEAAVTSRKMRRNEVREAENRGMEIKETIAGWVGIAVAVHPTNPINELTVGQIHKILAEEYKMWDEVGGMPRPISIVIAGNYRADMLEFLAQTFPKARLKQRASQPKQLSEEPDAVALVRFEETEFETKTKILAIKKDEETQAILPSKEAVDCGTYPFRQPLYAYVDWKNATDATRAFFNFCADRANRTPCE